MAGATLLGPSLGDLPDFLRYGDLSDAQRDELFRSIPESGAETVFEVRAPVAMVQVGRFALGASYTALGDHGVAKDVAELFLYGYETGRADYRAANTTGTRATFFDLAAGYGAELGGASWA